MPVRKVKEAEEEFEDEVETPTPKKRRRKSSRALDTSVDKEPPWKDEEDEEDEFFEDEDEDESPPKSTVVQHGWDAGDKAGASSTGKFFKVVPEAQLVRFIDPDGLLVFKQHWVNEAPGSKKSFVCYGDKCPLCAKGHRAQPRFVFSVLNLSLDVPTVQRMDANATVYGMLKPLHTDPRTGPLDKLFWSLAATGLPGKAKTWSIIPVKSRDLEEDWDIELADARALTKDAEALTEKDIYTTPYNELVEIAALLR